MLAAELKHQSGIGKLRLPKAAIHGDLFRDNVLFAGGRVAGIIDFGFAATDFLAYDLAIAVNDWCNRPDGALDAGRTGAFVEGYERHRPLTPDEREHWPMLLRAAALRFWLSRLYDLHLPRPGELVHAHDPAVYERISRTASRCPSCRAAAALARWARHATSSIPCMRREAASRGSRTRGRCSHARGCRVALPARDLLPRDDGGRPGSVHRAARGAGDQAGVRSRLPRRRMDAGTRRQAARRRPVHGLSLEPARTARAWRVFVAGITIAVLSTTLVDGGKLIDALTSPAPATSTERGVGEHAECDVARPAHPDRDAIRRAGRAADAGGVWFAPGLVVFQDLPAFSALAHSLRAPRRQLAPARALRAMAVFLLGGSAARPRARAAVARAAPRPVSLIAVALLMPYMFSRRRCTSPTM